MRLSTHSDTVVKMVHNDADESGDISMASTFSGISTPAVTKYMDMLNKEPPLASNFTIDSIDGRHTSHNAAADARKDAYSKLRKPKAHVDSECVSASIVKCTLMDVDRRSRTYVQA